MKKDTIYEEKKCNHNLDDSKNTLKKIKRIEMIYPKQNKYICNVCHKIILE